MSISTPERILLWPGPSDVSARVLTALAWRIGLMGHASTRRNVSLVLTALREIVAD